MGSWLRNATRLRKKKFWLATIGIGIANFAKKMGKKSANCIEGNSRQHFGESIIVSYSAQLAAEQVDCNIVTTSAPLRT